jgi:hypothetical protein
MRQKVLSSDLDPDSHTSIARHFGYVAAGEDELNKYEWNPLLHRFVVDRISAETDDRKEAYAWVRGLDFKTIVEPLIIKPIIHPFDIVPPPIISGEILRLLRAWDSVRDSVGVYDGSPVKEYVGVSTWEFVGVSEGARVSVQDSVMFSISDSVGIFVQGVEFSAWASVRNSVWFSVREFVWAYATASFLSYKHDFSSAVKLWEMGLVPSFDGETWRLHGYKNARILWEGKV